MKITLVSPYPDITNYGLRILSAVLREAGHETQVICLPDFSGDGEIAHVEMSRERYTPETMVDPDQLRARLEHIRADGYAWVLEEFSEGINSVAAPLFNGTGSVIGALHSHGPAYRFPDEALQDIITRRVVATAAAVSEALGHMV